MIASGMNDENPTTLNDRLTSLIHEQRGAFQYRGLAEGPTRRHRNLHVIRVTDRRKDERPTFIAYERTGRVE